MNPVHLGMIAGLVVLVLVRAWQRDRDRAHEDQYLDMTKNNRRGGLQS